MLVHQVANPLTLVGKLVRIKQSLESILSYWIVLACESWKETVPELLSSITRCRRVSASVGAIYVLGEADVSINDWNQPPQMFGALVIGLLKEGASLTPALLIVQRKAKL
jgi:hypothetical protein